MIEMITTKNHGRNGHFYFPSCNQLILNVKYKFVQCHHTNVSETSHIRTHTYHYTSVHYRWRYQPIYFVSDLDVWMGNG